MRKIKRRERHLDSSELFCFQLNFSILQANISEILFLQIQLEQISTLGLAQIFPGSIHFVIYICSYIFRRTGRQRNDSNYFSN